MNIIKKVIIRISNIISNFFIEIILYFDIVFKSLFYKNKIYIFGVPIHGNLGDQAILVAEKKYLKDKFPNIKVIEVPSKFNSRFLKFLVKDNTIIYTGGGFLGSIWKKEEEMFRKTLSLFSDNKIIVFPHTFYFEDTESGNEILNESIKIYSKHKNLHLVCREKYSYELMKNRFKENKVYLCPDMVLYLDKISESSKRNGIALCLRKDKEKVTDDSLVNIIKTKIHDNKLFFTSTVINKNIFPILRRLVVKNKIEEFSKYELIITDRLHGMIFSYLSKTPCIVFENKSYKIKGVYEWLKNNKGIKVVNDLSDVDIDLIMNEKNDEIFDFKKYDVLETLIIDKKRKCD